MKILIAPDKFKGSLSAQEVCEAIAQGLSQQHSSVEVTTHPLADGGAGSLAVLTNHFHFEPIACATVDPLGREMVAQYLLSPTAGAFIEVAAASGMVLLQPEERNPLNTTTYGTGLLVADALARGARHINLLLGGSATNDGGTGILHALGYRFLNENGKELSPSGEQLYQISKIVVPESNVLSSASFTVLCDVSNPFFGIDGAAHVFARQKGANKAMIRQLDDGLKNFSNIIATTTGKEIAMLPGAGAAGGIAGGLVGLLDAKIMSGTEHIFSLTDFEALVQTHDLIITGEGSLDTQSLQGKVVDGVAKLAKKHQKTFFVLCGVNKLSAAEMEELGAAKYQDIMSLALSEQSAMTNAKVYLKSLAGQMMEGIN